jgi:hypothetical protein
MTWRKRWTMETIKFVLMIVAVLYDLRTLFGGNG